MSTVFEIIVLGIVKWEDVNSGNEILYTICCWFPFHSKAGQIGVTRIEIYFIK